MRTQSQQAYQTCAYISEVCNPCQYFCGLYVRIKFYFYDNKFHKIIISSGKKYQLNESDSRESVFYTEEYKESARETKRYICNIFPHYLRYVSAIRVNTGPDLCPDHVRHINHESHS